MVFALTIRWIYFLKNEQIQDDFSAKGLAQAKGQKARAIERSSERLWFGPSALWYRAMHKPGAMPQAGMGAGLWPS